MEKNNKYLKQVLQSLPQATITYTHEPNGIFNVPYSLTAKNYKKLYLDDMELGDFTPEEQLILIHSNNSDPTYTPPTVLAGIYKARNISARCKDSNKAIEKCNQVLLDLNQATFKQRATISEIASQLTMHANLLEYYSNVKKQCAEYDRKQASRTAPIRNFVNRILEKVTRKPHIGPPFSQEERDRATAEWEKFRMECAAKPEDSDATVLKKYKYHSKLEIGAPFDFLYDTPELSSLEEEYSTTNIALQILDGSAYKRALSSLNRNPRKYLSHIESLSREK